MKKKSKNHLDNLKEQQAKKFSDYIFIYQEELSYKNLHFVEVYYETINNLIETATRDELASLTSKNGNQLLTEQEINILLKAQEFALNPEANSYRKYRCTIQTTKKFSAEVEVIVKALAPDEIDYDSNDYQGFVKDIAFKKLDEVEEKAFELYSTFELLDSEDDVIEIEWIGNDLEET